MFERMACKFQISCESVVSEMSLLDMMLDELGDGTAKRCDMEDPSNVHAPCRERTFPPWAAEVVAGCSGEFANPVKQQTKVVGGKGKKRKNAKATSGVRSASFKRKVRKGKSRRPADSEHPAVPSSCDLQAALNPELEDLISSLRAQHVPDELLPSALPSGKRSYTVHAPNGASVEVQHYNRVYIAKKIFGLASLDMVVFNWRKYGGASEAWEVCAEAVGWNM